jgi:hypothetical protein
MAGKDRGNEKEERGMGAGFMLDLLQSIALLVQLLYGVELVLNRSDGTLCTEIYPNCQRQRHSVMAALVH